MFLEAVKVARSERKNALKNIITSARPIGKVLLDRLESISENVPNARKRAT